MTALSAADGRRARGDATRRLVARTAADIATTHGLDAITVGGLSASTGVSKSGILTVFGNREAIQLAAVAEARQVYIDVVIRPALSCRPGAARLGALLDSWVAYLRAEVFPGGCFVTATSVEFGHRTGPVADAVRNLKREWLDLLENEFSAAGSPDPAEDAFRVDAYLCAGNTRRELFGTDAGLEWARALAGGVVQRHRT
ncbi:MULTISPECIES: TetR/AcrR family transcriptional regulator [Mycobacterium]|uniref:TetR family transcriptional regulator n=1 Tax=Mycobacterium syngnathidarum TaxID=1908205 RepID=A0A1S1KQG4_9MYCO|nr:MULTISPECIES: TetR/AcrR family transcriptional regulator [Mycobacterium]MCG7607006.1 TetR/AcrR family transcriptional regulator [Mycobacterium sp. CnD-18-1]OHU07528.1 TetR family transcriptional regulator [Mycobacterium syngnathidarum]OLT96462.1 TetR family transcriptional regulator [Mycobacterium syngnathidarum]